VEALTLEGLRELTRLREMATAKSPTPLGGGDPGAGEGAWAERAAACAAYLALLSSFASRTAAVARPGGGGGGIIALLSDFMDGGDVSKRLRFEWSSAAGGMASTFWALSGAPADAAMAAALLAAALGAGAAAVAAGLAGDAGARGEDGAPYTGAAALARRAAGAWGAVAAAASAADAPGPTTRSAGTSAAPGGPLPPGLALPGDRPAELVPGVAAALGALCLADAQALASARAEAKGLTPRSLAALHVGAAGLYAEARSRLDAAAVEACVPLAAGLATAAAVGAGLAEARARLATARDAFEAGLDPGKAIAELRAGAACLARLRAAVKAGGNGLSPGDGRAAGGAVARLDAVVSAATAALDRERLVVYMTPVPSGPAPLPEGKVVVAPTPLVF
jgi:hypothetical protein